jgi:hypothetical protein
VASITSDKQRRRASLKKSKGKTQPEPPTGHEPSHPPVAAAPKTMKSITRFKTQILHNANDEVKHDIVESAVFLNSQGIRRTIATGLQ